MTQSQRDTLLRVDYLTAIQELLTNHYETDVLPVSANELTLPAVDADGNEKWIIVKVSIPRGTRNGEGGYIPYDGYKEAEAYKELCDDKAQEKAEAEARKQAKIARDKKAREEKKALAEAKKNAK